MNVEISHAFKPLNTWHGMFPHSQQTWYKVLMLAHKIHPLHGICC